MLSKRHQNFYDESCWWHWWRFIYIRTSCKLTVMAQIKFPRSVSQCAKSDQVLVCSVLWSLNMLNLPLSLTPLSLTMHIVVKAELKLYLYIIMSQLLKIAKARGTGSWQSRSNASRQENRMAPDSDWTLRGREKFLLLPEIKTRFLGPATGVLFTVLNVLRNGMDA